jgi:hypothetical protein
MRERLTRVLRSGINRLLAIRVAEDRPDSNFKGTSQNPILGENRGRFRDEVPHQLRVVHFFGDHDPFSFWTDQDFLAVPKLLDQVKADGFNGVILVIPLFPFFADDPAATPPANPWYLKRLDALLAMVETAGLCAILRIAYPHSSTPQVFHQSSERVLDLARRPERRAAFAQYCFELAAIAQRHACCVDAFLCWEDFWLIFSEVPNQDELTRRAFGESCGFQHAGDTLVPRHETPAIAAWMSFFDDFYQERLGALARAAFGRMHFEVRSDRYPLTGPNGVEWLPFSTRNEADDQVRYCYWAPFFGARNEGETLTAAEATRGLAYFLQVMGERRNIVIEQFNFTDNTLAYAGTHARIAPGALPEFFARAAQLLAERSRGYGLWAYRDYRENMIYNSRFNRGLEDWQTEGAWIEGAVRLLPGQSLNKRVVPATRAQGPRSRYEEFQLEVTCPTMVGAELKIKIDTQEIAVMRFDQTVKSIVLDSRQLPWDGFDLSFESTEAPCDIQQVTLHGFVQFGGVRTVAGAAGPHLPLVVEFNRQLAAASQTA